MILSREGRIAIAVGAILAIGLWLVDPKDDALFALILRVILLVIFCLCMVVVVKELDWVNQRQTSLSLIRGPEETHTLSITKLGFGLFVALLITVILAVKTWPHSEKQTIGEPSPVGYIPTTKTPPTSLPDHKPIKNPRLPFPAPSKVNVPENKEPPKKSRAIPAKPKPDSE
jgi:hypothetical protein